MPHKVWAVGEEVLAADFNIYVQDQTVQVFASLTQLQTDWPGAPVGAFAFTADTCSRYMKVASGASGWVPQGPQTFAVGLSGTIPNSTSPITAGTIAVPAAPFTRLLVVSAAISATGSPTAVINLVLTDSATSVSRIGRGTITNGVVVAVPYTVPLPANTAATFTATANFTAAPGSTGAITTDPRFSQMNIVAYPA